jgi:hypothetical protein
MKRVMALGMMVVVVVVVAWTQDEEPEVRVGSWKGTTSQGYPMAFDVIDAGGHLTVDDWQIRLDLRCEATGRVLRATLWVSIPVPIVDRRFAQRDALLTMWSSWSGDFIAEDGARGSFATVWPVLAGEELEELRAEKCAATGLTWTASPGQDDDDEMAAAPVDLKLRIERNGRVTRM